MWRAELRSLAGIWGLGVFLGNELPYRVFYDTEQVTIVRSKEYCVLNMEISKDQDIIQIQPLNRIEALSSAFMCRCNLCTESTTLKMNANARLQ